MDQVLSVKHGTRLVSVLYVYFGNEKGFRLQCSFTVADKAKKTSL